MRLPLVLVAVALATAACGQTDQQFDARLRSMTGGDERQLLGNMGRIPDNSYQLDATTRVLQWRWDTSYVSPGVPPPWIGGGWGWGYPGFGWRGPWAPFGGIPPTWVRQDCIVEWVVENGTPRSYRWQGEGCGAVTIHSAPLPG